MKKQAKRISSLILALAMLLGIGAAGISGIGEIKASALDVFSEGVYSYTVSEDGEATITKADIMSGDVSLPETLGGYPVVKLENSIFPTGNTIRSIHVPANITNICNGFNYQYSPFHGCYSLERITVDPENTNYTADENGVLFNKSMNNLYHYPAKSPLKSYSIPSSVGTVKKQAFVNCNNLEEIYIPKSVSRIADDGDTGNYSPFTTCSNLKKITVEDGNRYLSSDENGVLYNADKTIMYKVPPAYEAAEYTVPGTVQEVSISSFAGCSNIEKIVISEGVLGVAGGAFSYCSALKSVDLPSTVYRVSISAFAYNYNLERINVSEDNPYYFSDSNGAFCVRAGEYDIGTVEKTMLYFVPQGTNAVNYKIDDGIQLIAPSAFSGNFDVESIEIPSSVDEIGNYAFAYCTSLKSVKFSEGLKTLGERAFADCDAIEEIVLPEGLETIGARAFENCRHLRQVYIPASVTSIGGSSFSKCDALESITVAESSESFASVDGVLFTKDKTELKWYPAAKTDKVYNIPEGTVRVTLNDGCESLEEIGVPASVEHFDGGYLPNLKKINLDENNQHMVINENGYLCTVENEDSSFIYICQIPYASANGALIVPENYTTLFPYNNEKITGIVANPSDFYYGFDFYFSGCYNLADVYFRGSEEEWNEIADRHSTISLNETMKEYGITVHFDYQDGDHIHNYDIKVNTAPTCSSKGSSTYTCSCGYSVVKETQPLGHKLSDLEWTVKSVVSCSEHGLEILECPDCGLSEGLMYARKYSKLPHEFAITAIPSTSTAAGELLYECKNCEHSETTEIPAGAKYIIYDVNGEMTAAVYNPGDAITAPEAPVKEGLEFIGWKKANGETVELNTMPDENLVLTPAFGKADNGSGVTAVFDEDCFAEGTDVALVVIKFSGDRVSGGVYYQGENFTRTAIYDICFKVGEREVQPEAGMSVEISIPVPEGCESYTEFYIIHRHDGRQYDDFTVKAKNGRITFRAEKFSEFEIYVKSGVKVKSLPTKLSYNYKETLDLSGLSFEKTDADGNKTIITDTSKMTVTGYDAKKIGTQTVTVEYEGVTAEFNVTVSYSWWQMIIRILLLGFLWY